MEADLQAIGKLETWELSHIFEHTRISNRASRAGKPLPSYPLDFSFTPTWLFNHSEQHKALRTQYGIPETYNFGSLDPNNKPALNDWLTAHWLEHQQIAAASP